MASSDSPPAEEMEHRVRRVDPEKCRQEPEAGWAPFQTERGLFEQLGGREDAPAADESIDLDRQRPEGGEVNHSQSTHQEVARLPVTVSTRLIDLGLHFVGTRVGPARPRSRSASRTGVCSRPLVRMTPWLAASSRP